MGNRCENKPHNYNYPHLQTERENCHQKDIYQKNIKELSVSMLYPFGGKQKEKTWCLPGSFILSCRKLYNALFHGLDDSGSWNFWKYKNQGKTISWFTVYAMALTFQWDKGFKHTRSSSSSSSSNPSLRCLTGGFGLTATIRESRQKYMFNN